MSDAEQHQYDGSQRQPNAGAQQRRSQPSNRSCRVDERIDEIGRFPHDNSPFSSLRRFLIARWVATFSAETDRPLACDASFSDISLSFIILIASRWSGGSLSIAPTRASSSELSPNNFVGAAAKVSCSD